MVLQTMMRTLALWASGLLKPVSLGAAIKTKK